VSGLTRELHEKYPGITKKRIIDALNEIEGLLGFLRERSGLHALMNETGIEWKKGAPRGKREESSK
jgi:hypothetical protein